MLPRCIDPRPGCERACFESATLRLNAAQSPPNSWRTLGVPPKDRPLDAGEFGTGAAASLAWAGCRHPALKDRMGAIELLVTADDRDDRDGAVALGDRLPEAAVRVGPRAERRQGVVAGIGADEQRAVCL